MLDLDWFGAMRRAVEAHRALFYAEPTIAGRTEYEGVGEGGDHALVLDRRCEDAVFAELEKLHLDSGADFVAVSEERGEVAFGDPESEWRVVVDPIDGSMNVRRTIPSHSLSVAIASGPSMADVQLGFVHEFGANEEFTARRGEGAWLGKTKLELAGDRATAWRSLGSSRPSRRGSLRSCRSWPAPPTGCGSSARSPSRSRTSPRAAWTAC